MKYIGLSNILKISIFLWKIKKKLKFSIKDFNSNNTINKKMQTYKIIRGDCGNLLFTPKNIPVIDGLKDNDYLYNRYLSFVEKSEKEIYDNNLAFFDKNKNEILLIIENRKTLPNQFFGFDFTNEFEREIKSQLIISRGYAYYKIVF